MRELPNPPPPRPVTDQKDLDRLVNEGGPDPVSPAEMAQRGQVWIETLERQGGIERLIVSLDHETLDILRQISRAQGVTLETLVGNVLFKFAQDSFVERHLETQRPPSP